MTASDDDRAGRTLHEVDLLLIVVEDDHALRTTLTRGLREEGYRVGAAATGSAALELIAKETPAAIVMDIGLPDADGRDVCQAVRARGVDAPVLFLTARDALTDRLSGFHAGGDDYLVKPFAFSELVVRVGALVRRRVVEPIDPRLLHLDPSEHSVRLGDVVEALTPTEYRVLAALVGRAPKVVRRTELVAAAWPDGAIVHDNTLDTYVKRVRRKLAALGHGHQDAISTVYGTGYRFEAPDVQPAPDAAG
jgi:two-component system, OmpR family, response regulator